MFNKCIKSRPSPIYDKSFVNRISLGNFEDDMHLIKDYDWVIEVVVERLDIKKLILRKSISTDQMEHLFLQTHLVFLLK